MHLQLVRAIYAAVIAGLVLAHASQSRAQPTQQAEEPELREFDLGEREAGGSYPLALGAENRNCEQPLDFEFSTNASWLRLPDDPVVRQVPAGQTRQLSTAMDFSNVPPGEYEAILEVDCQNCGFLIFKNCKIDKQKLRLRVRVIAGAAQQKQQQQQDVNAPALSPLRPSAVDQNDKRIPRNFRRKAKRAHAAWAAAVKNKKKCDEELLNLKAAADVARADAIKKKAIAETAEQDLQNFKAQYAAVQAEVQNAVKEVNDTRRKLDEAKAARDQANAIDSVSTSDERKAANDTVTAAQSAHDAANARLKKARAARDEYERNNYYDKEVKAMERDAKNNRKAADDAKKKADAADAALKKKQEECLKLQEDAAKAEAENKKAEDNANNAKLPAPSGPTQQDVTDQQAKANKCSRELGELLEAQRLALAALGALGALGDDYESDLELWANAVDDANDFFDYVPPGIPVVSEMVGTAQTALTYIRAAIGIARGVSVVGSKYHVPNSGNDVVNPNATKQMLQDKGFASSAAEADRVYEQMKLYTKAAPDSTKLMQEALEAKKAECAKEHDKLEALKKQVGGK